MSDLAASFEEHVRAALARCEPGFPATVVDSWSEPASVGQWVIVEDGEGRAAQARLDELIARGRPLRPGDLARSAGLLVDAVLGELRRGIARGGTIVSRPRPGPEADGLHRAHLEFRGFWLLLTVGPDPTDGVGLAAVLSCLMGRAVPLAEPEESVVWL